MRATILSIIALFFSTALIQMSNGLQGTLLPVRGNIEGFSTFSIGLLGSAFHAGLILGCFVCPWLVRRVGHIRAFAAFAAIASIAALSHVILMYASVWWIARALTGLCFAGMQMVIESWLNERSTNSTRGKILSAYTLINLTVIVIGQQFLNLMSPSGFMLFALASIILSAALVPIALTTSPSPIPIEQVTLKIGWLYRISPAAVLGAFGVGVANGSFWSLGPLFAQKSNLDITQITLFMSVIVLGGALSQWPVGWLSDFIDRRKVILLACLGAALAGGMIVGLQQFGFVYLMLMAGLFGVFALPLYAICLAHASDHSTPADNLMVSGGLLLLYGIGATLGPLFAAVGMEFLGRNALFYFTILVHLLLALAILIRINRQQPIPLDDKSSFVAVPETSPQVADLDPRGQHD